MNQPLKVMFFLLGLFGCGVSPAVQGYAHMTRTPDRTELVFCDSGERYGLGATTSNAAPQMDDVLDRLRTDGEVYVHVSGHEATAIPSAAPGTGADRTMSVGWIRALPVRPHGG